MYINKADMSMMDISRFVRESKVNRTYKDYAIETESYVLLKKEEYQRLLQAAEKSKNEVPKNE